MTKYIALLRGINVGGNNVVPMAELRVVFEGLGFENVKTYIQSGNCIFESDNDDPKALSDTIGDAIFAAFGFKPGVFIMTPDDLHDAIAENPFFEAELQASKIHFFFLGAPASNPDIDAIEHLQGETEEIHLTDNVFYMHAPDGIGRSKLAARAGIELHVPVTARNLRTVKIIAKMCAKG